MTVKVILTKNVPELGSKGDIVEVADGYARNYLVPKSLAVKATTGSLAQAEAMSLAREEAERRARDEAERLGQALVGTRVVLAARAGDEGQLFGSIGPNDIARAVHTFTGLEIDRTQVLVPAPIKEIGLHEVTVMPHPDVEVTMTLDVILAT